MTTLAGSSPVRGLFLAARRLDRRSCRPAYGRQRAWRYVELGKSAYQNVARCRHRSERRSGHHSGGPYGAGFDGVDSRPIFRRRRTARACAFARPRPATQILPVVIRRPRHRSGRQAIADSCRTRKASATPTFTMSVVARRVMLRSRRQTQGS